VNLTLQGDRTNQYACTYMNKSIPDEFLDIQEDLGPIQIGYENLTLDFSQQPLIIAQSNLVYIYSGPCI